jgi:hypothetical protein
MPLLYAVAWALAVHVISALRHRGHDWAFATSMNGTLHAMYITIPVTLFLAVTLRLYDRWRP